MQIDAATVARVLPHRDPILLIESVLLEHAGECGKATVRLPDETRMLNQWHGKDLVQELVLEAAAQALGVVLGMKEMDADDLPPAGSPRTEKLHLLLGFNEVEFSGKGADPSEALDVAVVRQEGSGPTYVAQFSVTQRTADIARGSVMVWQG